MNYSFLSEILPRYIRKVGKDKAEREVAMIEGVLPSETGWLPTGALCVPGYHSLGGNDNCKLLGYYPMDASSMLAIATLGITKERPVSVLDLCCCPGSKLMLLAECAASGSLVVGVDISEPRLNVCKSLLRSWSNEVLKQCKSGVARTLVFQGDGVKFGPEEQGELLYDSCIIDEEIERFGGVKKRNKSYRERESKRLKTLQQGWTISPPDSDPSAATSQSVTLDAFDYVLVDAECTHDASYRHMKYIPMPSSAEAVDNICAPVAAGLSKPAASLSHNSAYHGSDTVQSQASSELTALQQGLILNGFRRLRRGGVMVYSTCSQDPTQNEGIVQWLLDTVREEAELLYVPAIVREIAGDRAIPASTDTTERTERALGPALTLLQQDLSTVCEAIRAQYPTPELQRGLADTLCDEVAALPMPLFTESTSLPGTISIGYRGGMSGHFIAKIRKV